MMATPVSTRPARRTRKKIIIDEEDEDATPTKQTPDVDEEEEYTPAPTRSPQRRARKSTVDVPPTPRTATRRRKTTANESIEPSEIFDPEESNIAPPASPSKRGSPRKRKSAPAGKNARTSIATESRPQLPTPQPSVTPEPSQLNVQPLGDITTMTINERTLPQSNQDRNEFAKTKLMDTVLERPMDIVVRTRALGIPKTEEPAGPGSRTVIKFLVLINFKSYAGRQEVGPFHASFSSVVGPNGSGKSNVIDSLLFVFGFRASKMRQGKISALIHNSAAFPDLDHCEVEVHFEEVMDLLGGKHEVVPDSQLIISRRAFKNNSSKYYMNGRESSFTAVTSLLKERGVDLDHKRFLILQGEVESIAQMKAKAANEHDDGLLEYLEDIIGTSKYKTPIEESAVEVETLNEVCVEKSARVQHVEKEKNSLEDKKNKALAYVRDENELAFKESTLYQIYISECNDNLRVTEEAVKNMQAKLDEELGKHQGNEDDIKKVEKAYGKGQKEFDALEKNTQAILKEIAKLEKEKVKFEEKKKFLAGKQKKLEKASNTSRLAASEATSLIQKFSDDIERSGAEIAELEATMKAESEELAAIRDSINVKLKPSPTR